jgi:hypothetical protein
MRPSGAAREPSRGSGAVLTAWASQFQARDNFQHFFQVIKQGNDYDDDDDDDDYDDDDDDDDDYDDDDDDDNDEDNDDHDHDGFNLYTIQDDNLAKKQYPCNLFVPNRKI